MGGGFAAFVFSWMLAGRERIIVQPRVLAIRREVFGLGVTREYDLAHVRNLRVSPVTYDPSRWTAGARFWGVSGGCLAFDYGAESVRVGAALDEPEAAQVIKELSARHTFPP